MDRGTIWPPDDEWVPFALPWVEGRCIPEKRLSLKDGKWIFEYRYPKPDPDYVDPEIYETDTYCQEKKEEFYDYLTRCKACRTEFIAYDKEGERTMHFCPCCGKRLKGEEA